MAATVEAVKFDPNAEAIDPATASCVADAAALTTPPELTADAGVKALVVMVNVRALDVPPPGLGFTTVTCAVPAVARSLAGIVAIRRVALANDVVRLRPFQRTVDPNANPVPVKVNAKPGPPADALGIESEVRAGSWKARKFSISGRVLGASKRFGTLKTLVTDALGSGMLAPS